MAWGLVVQVQRHIAMMLRLSHVFQRLGFPLLLGQASSSAFAILGKPNSLGSHRFGSSHGEPEELPPDFPRRDQVLIALDAVRRACRITQALQPVGSDVASISTVEKADLSPVTVADYAVQASILRSLHSHFPLDGFMAEEDSVALRADNVLLQQVLETGQWQKEDMLTALDHGKSFLKWDHADHRPPPRVWCLDPIDGTKGFLRGKKTGGQYAVALALIENGQPVVGILGCPNLPANVNDDQYVWKTDETETNNANSRGCIFVASRGGGCYQLPLVPRAGQSPVRLQVTPNDGSVRSVRDGRFCIGVEKFSDALGQTTGMARVLHGPDVALDENGEIIRARRIDSQAKHGVIARGGAEWYVRLPQPGYVEWIWDHAAGNVVIEEAGGKMTDTEGNALDFSRGAKLSPSVRGILMSNGGSFHQALLQAFAQEEKSRLQHTRDAP